MFDSLAEQMKHDECHSSIAPAAHNEVGRYCRCCHCGVWGHVLRTPSHRLIPSGKRC